MGKAEDIHSRLLSLIVIVFNDDVDAEIAKRGSEVTFQLDEVIRSSDKLYKVVPSEEVQD